MSTSNNPSFILIHGGWHNSSMWNKVIPFLGKCGFSSVAIDLPGAGKNAAFPESFHKRPFDAVAFALDPSPNANVTQDERNKAVLNAIEKAKILGNGKVILVGHSLGGLTLSAATQIAPDKIHAVVYTSAFMLPTGMSIGTMLEDDTMKDSIVPSLFSADPLVVGAMRIAPTSSNTKYVERLKTAFYGDVFDADLQEILSNLHCDEPASVVGVPSTITPENFGVVPRHFIRCINDRANPLAAQNKMIELVDAAMGNETIVHTLESDHSPFYSQPDKLADILEIIAQRIEDIVPN